MALTAAEQYLLELVNRARLDPPAEAARHGIPLTAGGAEVTGVAKQALAPNAALERAAEKHAQWMFRADTFSHTGAGRSTDNDRAEAEGFVGRMGENLSLRGLGGLPTSATSQVDIHHAALWASDVHRQGMMRDWHREVGISIDQGTFRGQKAQIASELFGSTAQVFVTGVVYDDRDGNNFYTIGEGLAGVRIASGDAAGMSAPAGGYGIGVARGAAVPVDVTIGADIHRLAVDTRPGNVKIDVVNGARLDVSGSFDLETGGLVVRMLGAAGIAGTGSAAGDVIAGNRGDNRLSGEGGWDRLWGGQGADRLSGGDGRDRLWGDEGNDRLAGGRGNDTLDGGEGDDTLTGGLGADWLTGAAGADRFVFGRGIGHDIVADLSGREGDRIVLDDALWRGVKTAEEIVADHARMTAEGFVVLDFGAGGTIELRGITSTAGLAALIEII